MIKIFRGYNPFVIVLLFGVLVITRLGYFFNTPDKLEFIFVEPFARLLVPVSYEYALTPFLNVAIAALLAFIQALMVNTLVNKHNLLSRASYIPALMYVTLTALFTPFLSLSAPLICNFLLIWMLFKMVSFYKKAEVRADAFDLGLITALGSLIYLPFIYFFLAIWVALIIYRPFQWREWVAAIIGYATVFAFLAVIYYYTGRINNFTAIWLPLGTRFPTSIHINNYTYLLLAPVLFIFALSGYKLQQGFFNSYVHIRKSFQLLVVIFIIAGLAFYVKKDFQLDHFLLCAVPGAIAFAYYFLFANSRWFYETLYIILLAGIIYFQFNTF